MLSEVYINKFFKIKFFLPNHNLLPLISREILIFTTKNEYENNPHLPLYTNIINDQYYIFDSYNDFLIYKYS